MRDFAQFGGKSEEDWAKEVQAIAENYRGKSESELVRAIYARAEEGRREGTLTDEQIDAFYAQFSSLLDEPKRRRLKRIVEQLKKS